MSTNSKGLIKSVASLGLVQIANFVLPLISIPVISRIIGPDKLGVINYAVAFIAYFNVFIGYGFDFTATRRISKDPNNVEFRITVFNEVFLAKCLLVAISIIVFLICLYNVPPLAKEKAVAVYTFLLCIGPWFALNWLFQAMQDLPKIAWVNFICKLLFTVSILFFIRNEEDYILQPLLSGLMYIVISLLSFFWAFKRYHLRFKFVPLKRIFNLLYEERTVFFSLIAMNLYTTTNTVMLGLMQPADKVGYYTAAQRLMSVVTGVINIPLAQAFYPFIGMAFSKGLDNGISTVQKILPLIIYFTFFTSIGIFLFGPTVVHWFYGEKFLPSVPALQIIAFIPLIVAFSNMMGVQIMLNLKMDSVYFRICAGGAVLGLFLNFFMIKNLGFIGTAWNWLIVEIYISLAMYFMLLKNGINVVVLKQFGLKAVFSQVSSVLLKSRKRE
jgi:O-antigen/teichoic acid export membrane protein